MWALALLYIAATIASFWPSVWGQLSPVLSGAVKGGFLLLTYLGVFWLRVPNRRRWVLASAGTITAAGLLALVDWRIGATMVGSFVAIALLLGLVRLGLTRRLGAGVGAALVGLGWLAFLVGGLPPGVRFNLLMVVYLLLFIVAAGGIAAAFTYLFLKTFECLDRTPLFSFLTFLPLTVPAYYIVASALLETRWGAHNQRLAYALALDALVAGALLLLVLVRWLGSRWGNRHYTWMVAWKFLKSQRLVPTWKTRRMMAIRGAIPGPARGRRIIAVVAEILLLGGFWFVTHMLLNEWLADRTTLRFASLAVRGSVGAWAGFRFLKTPRLETIALGAAATAVALWLAVDLWFSGGGSEATLARYFGVAALGAASVLFASQIILRLVLHRQSRRNALPRHLDPGYAPPIENRIREGVSASMFVSVVGVAVGVWALIVVLSVMGGFSGDLRSRIVRAKDHVMVKAGADSDRLQSPLDLAQRISSLAGVAGASPYVEGDVMMASNLNVSSTVTLRGVDDSPVALAFLEPILVAGSLDLFRTPEALVPLAGSSYPGAELFKDSPDLPWNDTLEDTAETSDELEGLEPSNWDDAMAPMPSLEDPEPDPSTGLVPMPDLGLDEDGTGPMPLLPAAASTSPDGVLPTVIIGSELARSLGLSVGSKVTVISPDGDIGPMGVQPKARTFRVSAKFSTGMYDYDLTLAYMHLPDAQRFLNLGNDIDHIDVRLDDIDEADSVAAAIPGLTDEDGIEVLTWTEMNKSLFYALELERIVMFVVLGFIILIASFNIVSSLIIMIRRRLSAIGILKTMGATAREVVGLFFILGLAAGFFGTVSGVIMGLSTCGIIENLGVTLPVEYYIRKLPVRVEAWQVAQVAFAALWITALAALWPGRLAARVVVVEGLKDER